MTKTRDARRDFRENSDHVTSTPPITSTILSKSTPDSSIIISDVHNSSFTNHQQAILLAQQTGRPLALEMFTPSMQPYLDALRRHEITQDQLIAMLPKIDDGYFNGDMSGFIGQGARATLLKNIYNAIENGLNVQAVGNLRGMEKIDLSADDANFMNRYQTQLNECQISVARYLAANGKEFYTDPKGLFIRLSREMTSKLDQYPPVAQDAIKKQIDLTNQNSNPSGEDLRTAIATMVMATDPNYESIVNDEQKYKKIGSKPRTELSGAELLNLRQTLDPDIAADINQKISQFGPMVIVYGAGHTLHEGDLDGELRRLGRDVMVVDLMNPNTRHPEIAAENQKMLNSTDPNRFAIDVNTGTIIKKTAESSPTDPIQPRQQTPDALPWLPSVGNG